MSRARDRLNAEARQRLRWAGLTAPAWARWCNNSEDGQWYGDRCGCPDDRCMDGYHHEPYEPCGCLETLLTSWARGATSWADWSAGGGS